MIPDIEFKLDLPTLHPESVSASDLADLLRDLEQAVEDEATVEEDNQSIKERTIGPPTLALIGINSGSSAYQFAVAPKAKTVAIRLLTGLAKGGNEWASISPEVQEIVHRAVSRFVKKNIPVVIKSSMDSVPTATFTSESPPPVVNRTLFVQGETSLSVEVIKAGGIRPTASVFLIGEGYRVPISGNKKAIQKLGNELYKKAIIVGIANWRLKDWKLVSFKVSQVEPYPQDDVAETLKNAVDFVEKDGHVAHAVSKFRAEFREDDEDDE